MLIPLVFLSVGAIFAGVAFKELFIGQEMSYYFWQNSNDHFSHKIYLGH